MPDSRADLMHLKRKPDAGLPDTSPAHFSILAAAIAYTLFVIYGSLVPLNFQPHSWQNASESFTNIRYLNLGIGSRADWVANILLFVPLAFLWLGTLWHSNSVVRRIAATLFVLFTCASLSVAIEFAQIFFPPRTVSLNDIIAENIGAALGVALWSAIGMRVVNLVKAISHGGIHARYAALIAYALGYAALSLFPYDFLITRSEWQAHLASEKVAWLLAPGCGAWCTWKLIPEMLAFAPLGILCVLAFDRLQRVPLWLPAVAGMLSGTLIEGLQLTIASGISQGASVGSRVLGMTLGVWLAQSAHNIDGLKARKLTRGTLALGLLPYLAMVAWLSHFFSGHWIGWTEGWARLRDMHFLPFYYHYYTSESRAMVSLLFQTGLYIPIGAGVWLWRWAGRPGNQKRPLVWPAIAAVTLASAVETAKLFITDLHPDPSNIFIAAAAAMAGYLLLNVLFTATPRQPTAPALASPETPTAMRCPNRFRMLIGAAAFCMAMVSAATSPLGSSWVLPLLLAYAALLWWRPDLWLVWVLASLPLLDLTPWTGRLYWTEYDTLLLMTIGVGYLRLRTNTRPQPALRRPARLLLTAFALSATISLSIGLFPLGELDQNAFASYTSPYNALRAAKGLLFALAFIPLLTRAWNEPEPAARRLACGMTLGLAAEVLYVLWERVTFSGLFNFDSGYRIAGSFPGMHIGGAYSECYLVAALPFVALWAWQQQRVWVTLLAAGWYGLGAYSVMVTFSRGGQLAFVLATLIIFLGLVRLALRDRTRRFLRVGAIILITSVAAAIAWPIFYGNYSQSRLATTKHDLITRTDHWADALNIFHKHNAPIFGVGLGTFPSAYLWGSGDSSRPSTYAFIAQNDNTFLRLGSGETLYFSQPVAAVPEHHYTLSLDLRSNASNAALAIPICEQGLLNSFTCAWTTLQIRAPSGQWEHYEADIQTKNFGPPNSLFPRPVKLALYNGHANTVVDVDNVALLDLSGSNLVRNGDFSEGMHHWFFTTDSHLAWHIKNLYIHVLFEQGWIGLICFIALIAYAMTRLLSRAWNNDPLSLTLFTSLSAFLMIGTIDSLIDETRIGFMFFLLLIAGLAADGRSAQRLRAGPLR